MAKHKLILVSSDRMDKNKKEDRDEHNLIRMSAKCRDFMNFDKEYVEIEAENGAPLLLTVFRAYSDDLKWVKNNYSIEEQKRIGFVTTKTLEKVTKNKKDIDVWVSDNTSEVVFGTDPELLIKSKDTGNIVPAFTLLNYVGELGADGAMGELRPSPAKSPDLLVENILKILKDKKYKEIIDNYNLECSCYEKTDGRDYPVGGHIHIGNPLGVLDVDFPDREFIYKTFNKIVDELIALPLSRFDCGDSGKNRRTNCATSPIGGYGYFGEYRLCKNNNDLRNTRLEHRTLSGMWLIHPVMAKAVLGTAKAIIDEVWYRLEEKKFDVEYAFPQKYRMKKIWKEDFCEWENFPLCKDMDCTFSSKQIINILNSSDPKTINKKFMNTWLSKMKRLSVYSEYESYINLLYDILTAPYNDLKNYSRNLQENWLGKKKFIVD